MSVSFSKSGVPTVTFSRANVFPNAKPEVLNQFVGISDGNTVKVAVIGSPLRTFMLEFDQLTVEDGENIRAFLSHPLVNYGQNSFTFTDHLLASYEVRYLETTFSAPEVSHDNVKLSLPLTVIE